MYDRQIYSNVNLDRLEKIFTGFIEDFSHRSYSCSNNYYVINIDGKYYFKFNNNTYTKPIYKSSLIDKVYKLRHLYIKDCILDNVYLKDEYSFSSSSYKSYLSSYKSYGSYLSSYNSYSSYSSYYKSSFSYPFINISNYINQKERYKNHNKFISCDIKQSFFVMGYGLELI